MDNLVVLRAVLDRIDGVTFDTLEGRVAFQKRVYLAQAAGIPLGYGFSWNIYGPYSPQLAEDGRRLEVSEDTGESSRPRFTTEADEAFERYRRLSEGPPDGLTEGAWLELLASMHYLRRHSVGSERAREHILGRLRLLKPPLASSEVALDEAWRRLDPFFERTPTAA